MRGLALSLMLLVAAGAAAAPFAIQVGDTRIALDAPPGFADTGAIGSPRLQELAETLTSASNRVLLFALTDNDLRRFMGGDPIEARRYMVAVTPRAMEQQRVNAAAFEAFVSNALRSFEAAPPAGADYRQHLDARQGAQPLLAELRRDPDVVSFLTGARLPSPPRGLLEPEKPAQYVLSTTSMLLLRGRLVTLTVHASYESPADLEWIREATLRWIDDLRRLNSR